VLDPKLTVSSRGKVEPSTFGAVFYSMYRKNPTSFPQNSKVDGTPVWGGLQSDEVGDPIILAYKLGRKDPCDLVPRQTGSRLSGKVRVHGRVRCTVHSGRAMGKPKRHAQFIRLAFDIAAGRLLEQPAVVARRYLHRQP
jgi:hypothetical protein